MSKMKVSAVGCSLADYLYTGIDFNAAAFTRCLSRNEGDGGLNPGHLVFTDDLEKFTGKDFHDILQEITGGKTFDTFNLGGPAIVAMINAAQLSHGRDIGFDFYGATGNDETAERIRNIIRQTPVNIDNYLKLPGNSPFTDVLSDHNYNDGKGERTFVNNIGACWDYFPEMLPEKFFDADILLFGATALTPPIHDGLTALLKKGKAGGKINIVTTVFDFRNERDNPGQPWPMGASDESFSLMDLLIVDWDEAMKISGQSDFEAATRFFIEKGVKSFIVTHGAKDFYAWSNGGLFKKQAMTALPVCALADQEMAANPESRGDTTGCGDNFAGGVLASTAAQIADGKQPGNLDIIDACSWGSASGGFACFYVGGTYLEKFPGDKYAEVKRFHDAFKEQIAIS